MSDGIYGDAYYRWEWFRRAQWQPGLRATGMARRWQAMLTALAGAGPVC